MDISILLKTNLFWFSFLAPGLATSLSLRSYIIQDTDNDFMYSILKSYVYTVCLIAPFALASYIFKWPIEVASYAFIVLVLLSLVQFILMFYRHRKFLIDTIASWKVNINLVSAFLIAFLVFDYILSAIVGNSFEGDSSFHLAKILKTLAYGPSPIDPLFGHYLDSRHHYSIVHVIYAIACKVTGLSPVDLWSYSLSFFRFLFWAASYSFITYFYRTNRNFVWSSLAAFYFLSVFDHAYGADTYFATQPSTHIILLFVFSSIALIEYLQVQRSNSGANKILLVEFAIGVFLIGFSHPLYLLLTLSLITIFIIILIVSGTINLRLARPLVFPLFLPLIFPFISFMTPNHMPEKSLQYGLGDHEFVTFWYGKLSAVLYSNGEINLKLLLIIAGLLISVAIQDTRIKQVFILVTVVTPIIILNTPLFLLPLTDVMPFWSIRRILVLDRFTPLLFFVPLVLCLELFRKRINLDRGMKTTLSLAAILMLLLPSVNNIETFKNRHTTNQNTYKTLKEIEGFSKYIIPGSLVITTNRLDYLATSILDVYVLAIDNTDHANPATPDLDKRVISHQEAIRGIFNGNLRNYLTKPSYMITDIDDSINSQLALQIKLIVSSNNYNLYQLMN